MTPIVVLMRVCHLARALVCTKHHKELACPLTVLPKRPDNFLTQSYSWARCFSKSLKIPEGKSSFLILVLVAGINVNELQEGQLGCSDCLW